MKAMLLLGLATFTLSAVGQTLTEPPHLPLSNAIALKQDRQLGEANAKESENRPIFGRGDVMQGRADRDTTFIGNAELRKSGTVIVGNRISYYDADDEVVAVGNVRLNREGNVFIGPQLQLRLDSGIGTFGLPEFSLPLYNGRGRAERLDFLGDKQIQFSRAVYTTCPPDQVDWFIAADTLTIDDEQQLGDGRRASLYFKDKKIISLPVFEFPLGDGRRSGFLPPTYGVTSTAGFDLITPYYVNIAPNRDLTLYPRLMTKRGLQLGSQFRYLEAERAGDIKLEVNPRDLDTGTKRYYGSILHTENDIAGWRGILTARAVSDDKYFTDHARTILYSAERSLPRDLLLTRTLGDWNYIVRATRYQNILENALAPPYERLPQLTANWLKRDVGGFDFNGVLDSTTFKRPLANQPEGTRYLANLGISYPIKQPGWFVTPKLSLQNAHYSLGNTVWDQGQGGPLVNVPQSLNRSVPTFSLAAGMIFERDANLFNKDVLQTLEPRLFYTKTPYRNQSLFPVFDTATADFNFSQLFAENTFIGNDRIADTHQLTTAAITRLINPVQGSEYLRFAVGQRFYFNDQLVSIPGAVGRTDKRSDLLFAAGGEISKGFTFDSGMRYSLASGSVPRFSFLMRYLPRDSHIFNLALRYQKEELGQIDTSWQWPITANWNALGRINYTFLGKKDIGSGTLVDARGLVESVFGFEYKACCWLTRVVLQQFVTAQNQKTSTIFLQLELNGLGRIGSDPFEVLRRNIPGYRLPSDRQVLPSNYFGYE